MSGKDIEKAKNGMFSLFDAEGADTAEIDVIVKEKPNKKIENTDEFVAKVEKNISNKLEEKTENLRKEAEKVEGLIELDKIRQNSVEQTNITYQIHANEVAQVANFWKEKRTKSYRLQSFVTDEVWFGIKAWKKSMKIKKDTDAVEALLRLALGLKQI